MSRETELRQVYLEAIALTERQAEAIAREDWDQLTTLLEQRERCITSAEALINRPTPLTNRAELKELLGRLQARDEGNQSLIQEKRERMLKEMQGLNHSKTALSGYLDSFSDVQAPSFFNQDQ